MAFLYVKRLLNPLHNIYFRELNSSLRRLPSVTCIEFADLQNMYHGLF